MCICSPVLADEEVHQVSGLVGLAPGDHQPLQVLKVSGLQHLLLLPVLAEEHQHRVPDLQHTDHTDTMRGGQTAGGSPVWSSVTHLVKYFGVHSHHHLHFSVFIAH